MNKDGVFQHNHIENGHSSLSVPQPINKAQGQSWKGAVWEKRFTKLISGVVVKSLEVEA